MKNKTIMLGFGLLFIILVVVVCVLLPNANSKISMLNVVIDPVLVNENGRITHLLGGDHFTVEVSDSYRSQHDIPLNVSASENSFVEYRFTLNNVGETKMHYTLSLLDLICENFEIRVKYNNTQQNFENTIYDTISPNEKKQVIVIFEVADSQSNALCSGNLQLIIEL